MKKILLLLLISLSLYADCELDTGPKTEAYELYKEADSFYSSKEYSEAYKKLVASYEVYNGTENALVVTYTCVHYIPGPYSVKIRKEQKNETLEFPRQALGKDIKKFLNPNPYIFVQYQNDRTIVTAYNSPKTARGSASTQLALENFRVNLDGRDLDFGNIQTNETKQNILFKPMSLQAKITTSERFDFKLFTY